MKELNKKTNFLTLGVILGVLLIVFFCPINKARASECGGTVVCTCGDTVTSDYTLNVDLDCSVVDGNGLIIGADGITLDGNNHSIIGKVHNINDFNSFEGIYSRNRNNVSIKNFSNITHFYSGVDFSGSNGSTIQNVTVSFNSFFGIFLDSVTYSSIVNNTINSSAEEGLSFSDSSHNIVTGNVATLNNKGIFLYGNSISNILTNNSTLGNQINFFTSDNNNIDTSNTVEGKPILFLYGVHGTADVHKIYSGDISDTGKGYEYVGQMGLFSCISCSYVDLKNATLSPNNYYGVYFQNTSNSSIQNVVANSNIDGVYFRSSTLNSVIGNTFNSNKDITLDFDDPSSNEGIGIYLLSSSGNTIINNTINSNKYGISFTYSSSNNITGNKINLNTERGIYLEKSTSNNQFIGNTIDLNRGPGLYLNNGFGQDVFSNNFTENTFTSNFIDMYNPDTTDTYSLNKFNHNAISKMLTFTDTNRTKNLNDTIIFDISMFDPEGNVCTACTYTVNSPTGIVTTTKDSNNLTSSSTATRPGTSSLIYSITDANGNVTKKYFHFFVNSVSSQSTYYFRDSSPTHGQPVGIITDSKSLLFSAPNSSETWTCATWVSNTIDEMPNYPLANLSDINIYSWYKVSSGTPAYIGIQRNVNYSQFVDLNSSVPPASDFTLVNKNFTNLNWSMDYFWNWYLVSLKIKGYIPIWATFPSGHSNQPSYANFTYQYTTTPAIKSISNDNVIVLSATAPSVDSKDAEIVLENPLTENASTNIVLDNFNRVFQDVPNTISSDNTNTLTVNLASDAVAFSTIPLDITPSTGSVAVTIDTWNTDEDYYKKWIETGSTHNINTIHTVGDLEPNTQYSVKVDDIIFDSYTSDSNGEITFTYSGGYSTKTFEVVAYVAPIILPTSGGSNYGHPIAVLNPPIGNLNPTTSNTENKTTINTTKYIFKHNLKLGMTVSDIKELQKYLNTNSFLVAQTGAGSIGHETNYFGGLTKKAVIKFQLANGLEGDGIVGPKTREYINSH